MTAPTEIAKDKAPKSAKQKIPLKGIIVFTVLSLASFIGNAGQTATNAMLLSIASDLDTTIATAQWLTTAYILGVGVSVPLVPWLSKRFSDCFVIMLALGMMATGALLTVVTTTFAVALVARVLQALSVGIFLPVVQTTIVLDLPADRRGLFMGINGVAMGFSANIGPSIGGAMEAAFGWRSFFWLVLGIAVVLMVPTLACCRRTRPDGDGRLDVLSYALCSCAFLGMLLSFSNASNMDARSPLVWGPFILGVIMLFAFIKLQPRREHPLVDLAIFKNKQYTYGYIILNLVFLSFMGVALLIPLFIQNVLGGSALDAGMVVLPSAIISLFANLFGGVGMDKFGSRKMMIFASIFLAAGAIVACFVDESTPYWYVATAQAIRGVGIGVSITVAISWSLSDLPKNLVSYGSAFGTLCRQAAGSLGTSLMVLIVVSLTALGLNAWAYPLAFGLSAVAAIVCLVCVIAWVRD